MSVKPKTRAAPVGARRFSRPVEALVNSLAGSAGSGAVEAMAEIFEAARVKVKICAPDPGDLEAALGAMRKRHPELMVILAGDGTARAAASLCGPRGPLLAPLPGGTMNVLPKAIYGERDWRTALRDTLAGGVVRPIGGGEIGGHRFYVAAMLGSAAAFAPAREAARLRHHLEAWQKAQIAWNRAFTGRLKFELPGEADHRALALALICPLISRTLKERDLYLEVVAFDPHGPLEALRVGARVALSPVMGDWRIDEAVNAGTARHGRIASRGAIPALLDGEMVKLGRAAEFRFHRLAFRAFAPPLEAHP